MKKILIIDDELSIVNFISDVVNILGFNSKFLTDGKRALATAKVWKPDVISLDIMMPSPDGINVLAQLKADAETANIPVYVVTAVSMTPEMEQKLSSAQAVFIKPIDTRNFIERLRDLNPVIN